MDILLGYTRCEFSRDAFERFGHTVFTCDVLPSDHPNHLQCDIWDVAEDPRWGFGLFHPMCTYLTVSAAWAYKDANFDRYPGVGYHQKVKPGTPVGAERRALQDEAVANFKRLDALPYMHAIENPSPSFLSSRHRKPDQTIQPYDFNTDASKGTGFWLDRVPPLRPTRRVAGRMVEHNGKTVERWGNQTDSGQNRLTPNLDRWLDRSATYPGVANAFEQWARYLRDLEG